METGTQETEFKTPDMALAAFLLMEGFRHVRIEVSNGNGRSTAQVVFSTEPELHGAVEDYELGQGEVEPRDFMRKVAFVRNRMKDAIRLSKN